MRRVTHEHERPMSRTCDARPRAASCARSSSRDCNRHRRARFAPPYDPVSRPCKRADAGSVNGSSAAGRSWWLPTYAIRATWSTIVPARGRLALFQRGRDLIDDRAELPGIDERRQVRELAAVAHHHKLGMLELEHSSYQSNDDPSRTTDPSDRSAGTAGADSSRQPSARNVAVTASSSGVCGSSPSSARTASFGMRSGSRHR